MMNEIEQKLYDALFEKIEEYHIETQVPIGIYIADFVLNPIPNTWIPCVIEVDGQESHKTKEQRYKDYERERFLMKEGYIVIRFTGSEVFVNPQKCAEDASEIAAYFNNKVSDIYISGFDEGSK